MGRLKRLIHFIFKILLFILYYKYYILLFIFNFTNDFHVAAQHYANLYNTHNPLIGLLKMDILCKARPQQSCFFNSYVFYNQPTPWHNQHPTAAKVMCDSFRFSVGSYCQSESALPLQHG